ncbi:hypothetical protein B7C51_19350 [Paenibacillus larvae subsp. pulvifaciens]|uniref:Uncharacterized protein n=1 Tax=Paenibacillus larvae subsp. pulvifaciens TaxID=1477 RepID=A0A1V0UZB5_9BACL|nr:hypothetical protein B7C51_19350 [Paenibacillus larvae subsp. pulvifaciens]
MKKKLNKKISVVEVFWERNKVYICLVLGCITGLLYYLGILVNIRSTMSNMITFSSIVIGVNGVFLTLLITLQESPAFERLRIILPSFQTRLFTSLRSQIQYGLVVVMLSIIISMLPITKIKILSAIGVAMYFFFFWLMTFGSFYTVKLVTDIIVKNFKIPQKDSRF